MIRNRFKQIPKLLTTCVRHEDELPVLGNMVVTPSQIEKMADEGIPISSQNMAYRPEQGEKNPSWTIDPTAVRGVDPATLWEQSQVSKMRVKKAHKSDVERFGKE